MNLIDGSVQTIGAFYVFAGIVGARASLVGRTLDEMVAAVEGSRAGMAAAQRAARVRSGWMTTGSLVVLIAGAALLLRLDVARWAFVAAALLQALYLFYIAPVHLDAADPIDGEGRRQTVNAFLLFAAATGFVLWVGSNGWLLPIAAVRPELIGATAVLCLGFIVYIVSRYTRPLPTDGDER